jgi:hypothetical protein
MTRPQSAIAATGLRGLLMGTPPLRCQPVMRGR